jgi:hypothetical protein
MTRFVLLLCQRNVAQFAKFKDTVSFLLLVWSYIYHFCAKPFNSSLLQVTVKCVLCTEISPRVLNHIKEGPLSRRTSISTKINSIRLRDDRRQHQTWESHTLIACWSLLFRKVKTILHAIFVFTLHRIVNFHIRFHLKSWRITYVQRRSGRHVTTGSGISHIAIYMNTMVHDLLLKISC